MAVLKDLIVHGSSRFLNAAYFNQLKANDLAAEQGYFNKLIAVDGKISNLDVDDLTAQNATVIGLLDVKGELHTNSWTNANIATIDGSFYITPTVSCESGTFAYDGTNITVTAASGYSFGVDSLYTYSTSGTPTTYSSWPQYSRVLLTGEVKLSGSNEWQPLGTIRGQMVNSSTSSIKINSLYDSQGTTPIATLVDLGSTSITANFRKVKVSLYERASSSSSFYPIGIYMTALGAKGKTFIDIYGGGDAKGSIVTNNIDSGAMAKPVLRIGNLSGLPVLTLPNGTSVAPQGWGIYTNNGFFQGTIVSTQGKIGNFTLGTAIYGASSGTGPNSISATTAGIYVGTDGIRSNKSGDTSRYVKIQDGVLYAYGAEISGNVAATNGFTVTSAATNGVTLASMTANGITLGQTTSNKFNILITDTAVSGKGPGILLRQGTNVLNEITANGMKLYLASDTTNSIAEFGDTLRIGKANGPAFHINADSLVAYYMQDVNGEQTRTPYFQISPTSMSYGENVVASEAYVSDNFYDKGGTDAAIAAEAELRQQSDNKKLDVSSANSYGNASWDEEGTLTISRYIPPITSSETGETYAIVVGAQGIEFKYQGGTAASINKDQLVINKTVVLDEMQVGREKIDPNGDDNDNSNYAPQWSWKYDSDQSIYLKWIG